MCSALHRVGADRALLSSSVTPIIGERLQTREADTAGSRTESTDANDRSTEIPDIDTPIQTVVFRALFGLREPKRVIIAPI